MLLRDNEQRIKTYHHHGVFFVLHAIIVAIYVGLFITFVIIGVLVLFFYYLDRLVITNCRIVYTDWRTPFKIEEHEAELSDIQDITTEESGILSFIPIFDFGTFTLETASSEVAIIFKEAPDPENIKHFIYQLHTKPTKMTPSNSYSATYDSTRTTYETEDGGTGGGQN